MKKNLLKLTALTLTMSLTLSLSACGGKAGNSQTTAESKPEPTPEITQTVGGDITLSQYVQSGETIWFGIDSFLGKDSDVDDILVLEPNGDLYAAHVNGITLGQMEQMEDADIVSLVKQSQAAAILGVQPLAGLSLEQQKYALLMGDGVWDFMDELHFCDESEADLYTYLPLGVDGPVADFFRQMRTMLMNEELYEPIMGLIDALLYGPDESVRDYVQRVQEEYGEETGAALETLYDASNTMVEEALICLDQYEVQPGQYHLVINSDHTGNQTENMTLAYRLDPNGRTLKQLTLNYLYPAGAADTNCGNVVYDSTYGGFGGNPYGLFTRIDSSYNFVLDQIGNSDLPVDVDVNELFQS